MKNGISIIIPTFQEEKYIAAALSKLKNICSVPLEFIIIDGGSTDQTRSIARKFTSKVYQIGRGIGKARNFGARHAKYENLLFLDTDVSLTRNSLEKTLEILEEAEIVGATCNIMPLHSTFLEEAFFYFYNGLLRFVSKFRPHSRGEFLAVKKKAFLAVEGFNEELPCVEDHDLAFRLSKIGKFVHIDITVYESLRRFRELGFFKVVSIWFINYLFLIFRGKSFSTTWKPVR